MTLRAPALAALLAAAACAPRIDPRLVAQPIEGRTWVSARHRDHPLVGRIWDAGRDAFVDEGALAAAVAAGDFVLLGEVHDNPDHHLLQARLVRAITAAGRRPALAFEMLDAEQQPAIDAALARRADADALAKAVGWKESGWPDFALYRPIFAAGLEAGLPVVAANLPRAQVKAVVVKGEEALDPAIRARLAREEPLPAEVREALRAEMRESHCGALPERILDPLVLAQRARDAQMAARLEASAAGRGAILVTGNGHVRTDRGVPALLARDGGARIVAVAIVEVEPEVGAPGPDGAYGPSGVPADFVVFTPATERDDPCAPLLERARHRKDAKEQPEGAEKKDAAPGAAPEAAQ